MISNQTSEGVAVDLPLPWGKPAEAGAPLKVSWRDREWAAWEVFWFGRASAITDTPEAGSISAILDLTPEPDRCNGRFGT
ncbi:MAG: hypothetical protein CM15mP89_0430 [Gammaproteobacteria bacterium]|nr:MAG: hypothetical protein CM15mP89_0430 [Gammaproteobacteria bacterium]